MADKNNNDSHKLKSSATDNTNNCHNYQWRNILNTVLMEERFCVTYISLYNSVHYMTSKKYSSTQF